MNRLRILLIFVSILTAGCGQVVNPTAPTQVVIISTDALQETATFTIGATPTPDIAPPLPSPTSPPASHLDAPLPLPTATVAALELLFPTILPTTGSEYRPPLYPIPWALSPHDHFFFASPIPAAYPGEPIWDYRYGGIYFGPNIIHTGVDLPAPRGTPVLAAGPGTVVWAGVGLYSGSPLDTKDPYGNAVVIQHDFGYQDQPLFTVYAHMEEIDVVLGEWLNTGDIVGKVGSTGNTTGPHLHFEVRLGKNDFFFTRNPELWLVPPIGEGVLAGRVMDKYGTLLNTHLVVTKNLNTQKLDNAYTYGPAVVNSDSYYNENVVMGDLPAGEYELNIPYAALNYKVDIQILPGQVTYFSFNGFDGFDFSAPSSNSTPIP